MLAALTLVLAFGSQSVETLTVEFPGLPNGVKARGILTRPDGSTEQISERMTISSPLVGTYKLAVESVRAPGEILDTVYDGSPGTFTVKKDDKGKLVGGSISAKYSIRGGTGFFWFASERITEDDDFSVGQLRGIRGSTMGSGTVSNADRTMNHGARTQSSAIDGFGFVYVVDGWEGRVLRYSPTSLGSAGKATVHTGDDLPLEHASVDLDGNLWLSSRDRAVMIAAADLSKSAYVPKVTLTLPEGISGWGYPVFDAENNLYFVGSDMTVLSPADRSKSGPPAGRQLKINEGTAGASAFDKYGNLWVPNENGQIYMYKKSDLARSGEISGVETAAPQSVQAVAFDNRGGMLIYVRYGGNLLYRDANSLNSDGGKELGDAARASMYSNLLSSPPPAWSPMAKVKGWPKL